MNQISVARAVELIAGMRGTGRLFRVSFRKRSNGEVRHMTCRFGVTSHQKGGKQRYDAEAKRLLTVFECGGKAGKNGYRNINLDGLLSIKIKGVEYTITDDPGDQLAVTAPSTDAPIAAPTAEEFVFVTYHNNWADEIDVTGYRVFTTAEFQEFKAAVLKRKFPKTHYIGTNEEIPFDDADDYLRCLRERKISKSEYDAFASLFLSKEAGFWFDPLESDDEDEDDE